METSRRIAALHSAAMGEFELIDIWRGRADKYSWTPFDDSEGFNPDWWERRATYDTKEPWFVQVLREGVSGRVRLRGPSAPRALGGTFSGMF